MRSNDLTGIVLNLINLKKEGIYWDFKERHHDNVIDFIKDVICLSNVEHLGDRYLIFGIKDDFEIKGVDDNNLYKQADIIDKLRSANFADGNFPDIRLEDIKLEDKTIQVLIIINKPVKPYYLSIEKTKDKKYIHAGTIYSRNMDTNTPSNSVASSRAIEFMWKERFGLTKSAFEKFKFYLKDHADWEQNTSYVFFNKNYPEFNIRVVDNHNYSIHKQEWARGEIGSFYNCGNITFVYGLYYHETLLKEIILANFDGGKKSIVGPTWVPMNTGRIYYYLEESIEYIFQTFWSQQRNRDDSKKLSIKSTDFDKFTSFDIPIFKSREDLENFLKKYNTNNDIDNVETDASSQNKYFYSNLEKYITFQQ